MSDIENIDEQRPDIEPPPEVAEVWLDDVREIVANDDMWVQHKPKLDAILTGEIRRLCDLLGVMPKPPYKSTLRLVQEVVKLRHRLGFSDLSRLGRCQRGGVDFGREEIEQATPHADFRAELTHLGPLLRKRGLTLGDVRQMIELPTYRADELIELMREADFCQPPQEKWDEFIFEMQGPYGTGKFLAWRCPGGGMSFFGIDANDMNMLEIAPMKVVAPQSETSH